MTNVMNFFKRIFRPETTNTSAKAANENPASVSELPPVSRELFVNDQPPKKLSRWGHLPDTIRAFLDRDFFQMGFQEGYRYHSKTVHQQSVHAISAEFRNLIKDVLRNGREDLLRLTIELSTISGIDPLFEEQLKLTIAASERSLQELEHELELSVDREGLIAECLNNYHSGFLKGVSDYTNELILLRGEMPHHNPRSIESLYD